MFPYYVLSLSNECFSFLIFLQEDLEGGNVDCANISNLLDRETMIKNALELTNKAIDDIDSLLATSKCSSQNIPLQ